MVEIQCEASMCGPPSGRTSDAIRPFGPGPNLTSRVWPGALVEVRMPRNSPKRKSPYGIASAMRNNLRDAYFSIGGVDDAERADKSE